MDKKAKNPKKPKQIVLCDSTCAGIHQGGDTGQVDIVLGCATLVK